MWDGGDRIDECIKAYTEPEPFSGVVHLSRDGEVLFAKAYGLAQRAESIPNRIDTRFQTASGCKVFTATSVLQLIDEERLALDTPLTSCVDAGFPHYDPGITVGHLLTHTSGITSYFEEDVNSDYEALWKDVPMYRIRRPADFLPLFQDKPMKFSPGEGFEYNDGDFILLGLVVEAVSGIAFSDFVREHVFVPAGMKDSGYFATDRLPGRTAYAYIRDRDGSWRTNFFAVPVVGAPDGGAYTTAPDMMRFWAALRGGKLLSGKTAEAMLTPGVSTSLDKPYSHYGLGVWIDRTGGVTRKTFVEGSDPGVALRSGVYAEKNLILTMLGNTDSALWPLYRQLEDRL